MGGGIFFELKKHYFAFEQRVKHRFFKYPYFGKPNTLAAIINMHQSLTERDIVKLKSTTNVFKIMHVLFFAFAIIISLLSGLFGLKAFGYLETAGMTFLFLILIYIVYFLVRYSAYRKDLSQQTKIAATVRVVKKSRKETNKVIWTDNASINRIEVLNREAFHLIEVGDELYVEQTINSKFLLRLEKQGNNLINDG